MALYDPEIKVMFNYTLNKNKREIKSFEFISKNKKNFEFIAPLKQDFSKIYEILKTKMTLKGFHENFKAIKKIGTGNFASVKPKFFIF